MRSTNTFANRCLLALLVLIPAFSVACAHTPPPAESATTWKGPFFFITMTDPQLGFFTENADTAKETELLEKAIAHANRLKPAFVVMTGDLIHKPGDDAQRREFLRITATLDRSIPLHLLPGNHDLGNVPTPQSIDYYRQHFGPDHYSFDMGGCHFVALNTTLMHSPAKAIQQEAEQWTWLTTDLQQSATKRPTQTILFQHHPTFLKNPDEPNDYHTVPAPRRAELLQLCRQYNIAAVFAGHLHRGNAATYRKMHVFAAGPVGKPLGKDPSGLTIVKVYPDRVDYEYHSLGAVPASVTFD
jgi:3',5'-cyclic AMP phosphodiesterase CpdA